MLKKDITYTDFDGNEQTDTFYFNFTKTELIRMMAEAKGETLEDRMKRIAASKNNAEIVAEFEKFVLSSYGIRSDDGKRFSKTDEIRENFRNSAAYDELVMSFFTGDDAGSDFINGIMPKSLMDEVNSELEKGKSPSDIARERSEANMQGHLTKQPTVVENTAAPQLETDKDAQRAALLAQLEELNNS